MNFVSPHAQPPGQGLPSSHPKLLSPCGQLTWSGLVWVVAQMASCLPNICSLFCLSRRLQFYSGVSVPSQQATYFLAFHADRNGQWAEHVGCRGNPHWVGDRLQMPFCYPPLLFPGWNTVVIVGAPGSFWMEGNLDETTLQRLVEEKEPQAGYLSDCTAAILVLDCPCPDSFHKWGKHLLCLAPKLLSLCPVTSLRKHPSEAHSAVNEIRPHGPSRIVPVCTPPSCRNPSEQKWGFRGRTPPAPQHCLVSIVTGGRIFSDWRSQGEGMRRQLPRGVKYSYASLYSSVVSLPF